MQYIPVFDYNDLIKSRDRIGRIHYLLLNIELLIISLIAVLLIFVSKIFIILIIPVIVISIMLTIRRLHDFNLSGWWMVAIFILSFIPYLNLLSFVISLLFYLKRGTVGENRFGGDPVDPESDEYLALSAGGKVVVYSGIGIFVLALLGGMLSVMIGNIGDGANDTIDSNAPSYSYEELEEESEQGRPDFPSM